MLSEEKQTEINRELNQLRFVVGCAVERSAWAKTLDDKINNLMVAKNHIEKVIQKIKEEQEC